MRTSCPRRRAGRCAPSRPPSPRPTPQPTAPGRPRMAEIASDLRNHGYKLYYCGAFGIPFGLFGTAPPPGMVDTGPEPPAAPAYRGLPLSAIRREVLMAAHEGSEHAERAEQRGIGEATLEQFRADVRNLSAQYLTGEPYGLFTEMRRVWERVARGAPTRGRAARPGRGGGALAR